MATRRSSKASTIPLVVGGLLVLAVALGVALLGGDGGESAGPGFDPSDFAEPMIEGEAVPTGATGVEAPDVRADALLSEGQNEIPAEGEGTMIVFLAHWCPHCNAEVPVINQWLEEVGVPEGTEVRTVATAIDETQPNYPPDEWLRERDWTVPTLTDIDGSIAAAYGVDSYPYWVFVDADGIVQGAGGAQSIESLTEIAETLRAR